MYKTVYRMGIQNKRYRGRIYRANSLFVSKRSTTDGVVICNPIDTIEIGEEYTVRMFSNIYN